MAFRRKVEIVVPEGLDIDGLKSLVQFILKFRNQIKIAKLKSYSILL